MTPWCGPHESLRPGIDEETLDSFEARFSVRIPCIFYRWRDGQDPSCFIAMEHNRTFSSLAEIADPKALLDDIIGSDFEDRRWLRRAWIANRAGDHLCLDLIAQDADTPGQVIAFYHDWSHRPDMHPDFATWLHQWVKAIESSTLELASAHLELA